MSLDKKEETIAAPDGFKIELQDLARFQSHQEVERKSTVHIKEPLQADKLKLERQEDSQS